MLDPFSLSSPSMAAALFHYSLPPRSRPEREPFVVHAFFPPLSLFFPPSFPSAWRIDGVHTRSAVPSHDGVFSPSFVPQRGGVSCPISPELTFFPVFPTGLPEHAAPSLRYLFFSDIQAHEWSNWLRFFSCDRLTRFQLGPLLRKPFLPFPISPVEVPDLAWRQIAGTFLILRRPWPA